MVYFLIISGKYNVHRALLFYDYLKGITKKLCGGGGGNSFGVKTIPLCVVHTWAVVLHFLGPQNQWHFPPKLYTLSHAPWFS